MNEFGAIGVKYNQEGIAQFMPIQILQDTKEGMWVSGLPTEIELITVGQEFVQPGSKIQTKHNLSTSQTSLIQQDK